MTSTSDIAPAASRAELREGIWEAARGVTARYGRSYFRERAEQGGGTDELWQEMAAKGLLAVGVPEELGGLGGGLTGTAAVMESMSTAGVPPILFALTAFSRESLIRHGSPEQVAEHVRPTMTGARKICFGVTEPDAGTNSFAMRTSARRTEGGWIINGQKAFISAADEADHMLLITRSVGRGESVGRGKGFTLFLVDLSLPGIELRRMAIDWQAPDHQYEVFLSDLELPDSAVVGTAGEGFSYLFSSLNGERVVIGAWALGLGAYALGKAVSYARERAPFGTPIGAYQAVQHPLATAHANLEAARLMLYAAAEEYDGGGDAGAKANMAKLLCSRAALQAVEAAIQTHGGHAFVAETDVASLWPMVRAMQVGPINNESVLNYIGQHVLGLPKSFETHAGN